MVAPPLRTPSCQIGCGAQPGQTQMAYTSPARESGDTATRHARLTKEVTSKDTFVVFMSLSVKDV